MSIGQQNVGSQGVPLAGPFPGGIVEVSAVARIDCTIPCPVRLCIGDANHVRGHAHRALGDQVFLTRYIPTETQRAAVDPLKLTHTPVVVAVGEKRAAAGVKVEWKRRILLRGILALVILPSEPVGPVAFFCRAEKQFRAFRVTVQPPRPRNGVVDQVSGVLGFADSGPGIPVPRIIGVIGHVHLQGDAHLLLIVHAEDLVSLGLGLCQGRKEQGRQDGDDGNHHQQLDQREPPAAGLA